jgi:amino acid adenylation domain-containing protein
MSFGELNRRANQVARYLRALGVGPDVVVGVCLERSPEMVVALLGVLKAGAAYAPLDSAYPRERLAFMAEDAGGPVLLTERSLMETFAGQRARVVCLDADWDVISREADDDLADASAPENLAYCIYTSGSTGRPKGVGVTRGSLLNLIHWYGRAFDLTPADQSMHLSGIGFDVSVMDLWPNLAAGVCVHQPPDEETRLSPEKLRDWIVASRITVGFAPTPLAELMLELEWPAGAALRVLTTGGDKLHRYPGAALRFSVANIYGPTENTVGTTVEMLEPGGDEPAPSPPIGRPFDNIEVYLLDSRLRPAPVGVVGELYVGGESLARGYWRRPDLTAERFIPHPFSDVPGARLYRIGDLGRYLPDGRLEYLGRVDFQVKMRGYRIELGEIETVLAAHEAVGAAVVILREDAPGDKQLVAYVTPADEEQLVSVGELRGHLRERLPEYMVPSAFVVLGALPLTPNGKVDRRALPAPGAPPVGDGFVAPRNAVEEALADIWRDVLGVERVGVFDDFFELGGHSLMATRVLSNVRRIFRLELPLRVVFEAHTIAELAPAVVTFETRPGQTEKIARVLRKLKGISAEEVKKELERKREERGRR